VAQVRLQLSDGWGPVYDQPAVDDLEPACRRRCRHCSPRSSRRESDCLSPNASVTPASASVGATAGGHASRMQCRLASAMGTSTRDRSSSCSRNVHLRCSPRARHRGSGSGEGPRPCLRSRRRRVLGPAVRASARDHGLAFPVDRWAALRLEDGYHTHCDLRSGSGRVLSMLGSPIWAASQPAGRRWPNRWLPRGRRFVPQRGGEE